MARIFQRLQLFPLLSGGGMLEWTLNPLFQAPFPHTYQAQFTRVGTEDDESSWRDIGSPITGSGADTIYTFTDNNRRAWSTVDRCFYRVKLTAADDSVYFSEPIGWLGSWDARDWRIAREVLRKETLRLRYVGSCGTLYRRRYWGSRCDYPGCLDHDTKASTFPHCPVCFGTGWKGGYGKGVSYPLDYNEAIPEQLRIGEGVGTTGQMIARARGLPCPVPKSLDIWADEAGERWYIDSVSNVGSISGLPVNLQIMLRQAQPSDVAFLVSDVAIQDALDYTP